MEGFPTQQYFYEEHITMFPSSKHTHIFDTDYTNINNNNDYL